ncbi:MAG: hypothetical protein Kow00108_08310 [Calditrichia bacterium]
MNKKFLFVFIMLMAFQLLAQERQQCKEHDLLLMPTAFTMERGRHYFTSYNIILANYSYALTNRVHIAMLGMLPVIKNSTRVASVGIKYNLLNSDKGGVALYGTYFPDDSHFTIGGIYSHQFSNKLSGHISIGYFAGNPDPPNGTSVMIGIKHEINKKSAFIVEYLHVPMMRDPEEYSDEPWDLDDNIVIGYRIRGKGYSLEIGPLINLPWLIPIPVLKATLYFGR